MDPLKFHLSMKNYSDKTFVDKLRSTRFPDYTDLICVNDAYEDFTNSNLKGEIYHQALV